MLKRFLILSVWIFAATLMVYIAGVCEGLANGQASDHAWRWPLRVI